jgi:deoxyribodipyrimidine photo-lyase
LNFELERSDLTDLILFWHRRDLRLSDNVGLVAARQQSRKIVGVFCLDRKILQGDDVAPARVNYMIGCLQNLQQRYLEIGSQLLVIDREPERGIAALAAALKAAAVFWNWDVEPYSQKRDRAVTEALKGHGIAVQNFWDQLLHPPDTIYTGKKTPYTVYTPFWNKWIEQRKEPPVRDLKSAVGLTAVEQEKAREVGAIALPTAQELGFIWDKELIIAPGELAAKTRLNEFCDRAILSYQEQRNFPYHNGTSQLSPALKFGAIGIRTVWQTVTQTVFKNHTDAALENIQTWQQELAWREFYQYVLYHFPQLATGAYRQHFQNFPWDNNETYFQAWCAGKTGYPIIDAAMRQLNTTGWMHNRCRMIVASFLTKDLIINWQWGEKYFMQHLIDGDLAANNGGWQWSASSGMDAKPLRIFNPTIQAEKFDPQADYIRQWVPELAALDTKSLLTGKISEQVRQKLHYPTPIVNHQQQKLLFKERYKLAKSGITV